MEYLTELRASSTDRVLQRKFLFTRPVSVHKVRLDKILGGVTGVIIKS